MVHFISTEPDFLQSLSCYSYLTFKPSMLRRKGSYDRYLCFRVIPTDFDLECLMSRNNREKAIFENFEFISLATQFLSHLTEVSLDS